MTLTSLAGLSRTEIEARLGTSAAGLSSKEAADRALVARAHAGHAARGASRWDCLQAQLKSPLVWMLVFAAGASSIAGSWLDAGIVLAILVASIAISYTRE